MNMNDLGDYLSEQVWLALGRWYYLLKSSQGGYRRGTVDDIIQAALSKLHPVEELKRSLTDAQKRISTRTRRIAAGGGGGGTYHDEGGSPGRRHAPRSRLPPGWPDDLPAISRTCFHVSTRPFHNRGLRAYLAGARIGPPRPDPAWITNPVPNHGSQQRRDIPLSATRRSTYDEDLVRAPNRYQRPVKPVQPNRRAPGDTDLQAMQSVRQARNAQRRKVIDMKDPNCQ